MVLPPALIWWLTAAIAACSATGASTPSASVPVSASNCPGCSPGRNPSSGIDVVPARSGSSSGASGRSSHSLTTQAVVPRIVSVSNPSSVSSLSRVLLPVIANSATAVSATPRTRYSPQLAPSTSTTALPASMPSTGRSRYT